MPKLAVQPAERAALVNSAVQWYATQGKNIPAENIEKDFWVTEALRSLSTTLVHQITGNDGAPSGFLEANIVFKGGTSLSKAHGLIDRFSEDIDLFVEVTFQQDPNPTTGTTYPKNAVGDNRADLAFRLLSDRVARDTGLQVTEYLDKSARSGTRRAYGAHYAGTNAVPIHLKPVVLIELTRMGSPRPNAHRDIESLLATYVHQAGITTAVFDEFQGFNVVVLEPRRTLVEKLCALEYQSLRVATGQAEFTRMARHFYDVGSLLTSKGVLATLSQDDVIAMASDHFALSKAVRRETGARPEGGFANSAWLTIPTAMEKAQEAYDTEVPELAYVAIPTFTDIQQLVRFQASLL